MRMMKVALVGALSLAALVVGAAVIIGRPVEVGVIRACLEDSLSLEESTSPPSPEDMEDVIRACYKAEGRLVPSRSMRKVMDGVDEALWEAIRILTRDTR